MATSLISTQQISILQRFDLVFQLAFVAEVCASFLGSFFAQFDSCFEFGDGAFAVFLGSEDVGLDPVAVPGFVHLDGGIDPLQALVELVAGFATVAGCIAVDAPLDLARFYHSAYLHKNNFKEGMLQEAEMMIPLFDSLFNGDPNTKSASYKTGSVFSHDDSLGGNAHHLRNTDILIFHEPDIDWWINERGASYYDINSYDLAAFALFLKSQGNENVELITTSNKGFDNRGIRNPHSWSIVDEEMKHTE